MNKLDNNRVVITGMGCITPVGHDYSDSWQAIKSGQTGIAPITQWDVSHWAHPLAAEIKDFQPTKLIADRKLLKLISRQDVIGLNAAQQAINDSQLIAHRESLADAAIFNDRTGVFVGSPGTRFQQQYDFLPLFTYSKGDMKKFAEGLFEQIHPMWLLRILPNNVLAYVGIQHGFKGANENFANHAISGTQAIHEAYRHIKQGIIDRAVVVAYECGIEPEGQIYYGSLGALSTKGLHPFDQNRDGTILAEGAGALVLESYESAKLRQAKIYGEILGGGTTSEAMGVFPIRSDGDGLIRAIEQTLKNAQVSAIDIGMITAHGNATLQSDASENVAINHVFGDNTVPVTGFKWSIGHGLTSAGALETIFTLLSLNEGVVPGVATLENKAQDCQNIRVEQQAQATKSSLGLLITRGFASINSCLVINGAVD